MSRNLRKVPPARPCQRISLEGLEERVTPTAANQSFVDGLYQSILHRPADPNSAGFVQGLDNGTLNRFEVAFDILTSAEGAGDLTQGAYQQYLKRPADPTGFNAGQLFLENGGDLNQVDIALASSNEFFTNEGGGTNAGYVNALYMAALNRSDAGDPAPRGSSTG